MKTLSVLTTQTPKLFCVQVHMYRTVVNFYRAHFLGVYHQVFHSRCSSICWEVSLTIMALKEGIRSMDNNGQSSVIVMHEQLLPIDHSHRISQPQHLRSILIIAQNSKIDLTCKYLTCTYWGQLETRRVVDALVLSPWVLPVAPFVSNTILCLCRIIVKELCVSRREQEQRC